MLCDILKQDHTCSVSGKQTPSQSTNRRPEILEGVWASWTLHCQVRVLHPASFQSAICGWNHLWNILWRCLFCACVLKLCLHFTSLKYPRVPWRDFVSHVNRHGTLDDRWYNFAFFPIPHECFSFPKLPCFFPQRGFTTCSSSTEQMVPTLSGSA